MIGSHDTYTYLKAKSWVINLGSRFWKCQDKCLQDLYNSGVRFFDIRVFLNKNCEWQVAHGLAEFNQTFKSLENICKLFSEPGVKFRIWLEKGSDLDWAIFKSQTNELKDKYEGFVLAVRKSNEEKVFLKSTYPNIKYYCCKMENPKNILKGLYINPIKDWVKKHNPEITLEMIDDPNTCYFMDFV